MTGPPLSPGDIAIGDQLLAAAGEELDTLVAAVRAGDEKHGEAQNLADFMAYLGSAHSSPYLAALVVVAVRRIDGTP